MRGPEAYGGQPHDDILAWQPDTADGLAPERLGLDDPAELPVLGAPYPLIGREHALSYPPHIPPEKVKPNDLPATRCSYHTWLPSNASRR